MLIARPPMGWNSWNTFTKDINEQLICDTADLIVKLGLDKAGYEYVVIDDCWSEKERDENGNLVADHIKFPHGMKYVADHIHSLGLKFGMYSDSGPKTCAGYPGSYGHEFQDAKFFAKNGVDYLKYDNCYHPSQETYQRYNRMALALKESGRHIVFSACTWGSGKVHEWARSCGVDLYRSTGDIFDNFESIKKIITSQKEQFCKSGVGCYNDIDMLVTGLKGKGNISPEGGCTDAQYRYHFAAWCFVGSPLMIGCDLRNITDENLKLLKNKKLIRINQDSECRPPIFLDDNAGHKDNLIMFKHLDDGTYAIGLFNSYDQSCNIMLQFYEIGLDPLCGYGFEIKDVFTGKNLGVKRDYVEATVPAGDCKVFLAKLKKL